MTSIKKQIIEGYNKQISSIKEASGDDIESRSTLVTFRGTYWGSFTQQPVETKFSNININKVKDLTDELYVCEGMTPLYDAIGKTIKEVDKELGEEISDVDVIVTTLTDGQENASTKFTGSQVADLIQEYTENYKWVFNFIGANIDVEALSKELNISQNNTIAFSANAASTSETMDRYTRSMTNYYNAVRESDEAAMETKGNFMVD